MAEHMKPSATRASTAPPAAEGLSLSRWSRLKRQAALGDPSAEGKAGAPPSPANAAAHAPLQPAPPIDTQSTPEESEASAITRAGRPDGDSRPAADPANRTNAARQLPPLSSISLAEDFTPFMRADVPQALKQQALKALFKAPHFNVMDGLDIYIDDYTQFEPISPDVMNTLSSWQTIMNPTTQVVTDSGYAVDATSAEGEAVLLARAERASALEIPSPSQPHLPLETAHASDEPAGAQGATPTESHAPHHRVEGASSHPRHGKRVGEFAFVDTPLISSESDALVVAAGTDGTRLKKQQ